MDILSLLDEKGIYYERKGADEISIICPNQGAHSDGIDSTPSFNISLSKEAANCFACGYKMGTLGLTKWLIGGELDDMLLKGMSLRGKLKRMKDQKDKIEHYDDFEFPSMMPPGVPWDSDYREIKADTYKKLGAIKCTAGWYNNRLCFPVTQHGRFMGFDGRALGDEKPKYLRPKGCDCKSFLYPFDLAKEAKIKRAVLCEGLFHSINYLDKMGLPEALCYFGSNNWSEHKLLLLLELNVEEVVFFPDNDTAGIKAMNSICPEITSWVPTYYVPPELLEEGKDLGDLTKDEIEYCLENKRRWK